MGFLQDQCSFGFYNHEKADTSKPFRCGDEDEKQPTNGEQALVGNIQFRPPFALLTPRLHQVCVKSCTFAAVITL
jgi:hypothetical protein